MTRYTVVWNPLAENELAELWIGAEDRGNLSRAADLIDRELGTDAHFKRGESFRALT